MDFEESPAETGKGMLVPLKKSGEEMSMGGSPPVYRWRTQRRYRRIDFQREKLDIPSRVAAIEYDPNRSARMPCSIMRWEKRYILAPLSLKVGETSWRGRGDISQETLCRLRYSPGTLIHNVELKRARARKSSAAPDLPDNSWQRRKICPYQAPPGGRLVHWMLSTIGQVGNLDHENISLGKAGRAGGWEGILGSGVAMNPVDHPLEVAKEEFRGNTRSLLGSPDSGYKTRKQGDG